MALIVAIDSARTHWSGLSHTTNNKLKFYSVYQLCLARRGGPRASNTRTSANTHAHRATGARRRPDRNSNQHERARRPFRHQRPHCEEGACTHRCVWLQSVTTAARVSLTSRGFLLFLGLKDTCRLLVTWSDSELTLDHYNIQITQLSLLHAFVWPKVKIKQSAYLTNM